MFRKHVKYNLLLALAILFAICYQSLHIFTDDTHHFNSDVTQEKTSKTHLSTNNQEDCQVCEFEFAAFLSSEVYVLNLVEPQPKFHFSNTYESIVQEKEFLYFSHRGPPVV